MKEKLLAFYDKRYKLSLIRKITNAISANPRSFTYKHKNFS